MRRQDVQLITRARKGDLAACFEAGRKYLEGVSGFPRHVTLGLDYLGQAEAQREDDAQRLIVESLDLYEIALHGRVGTLERAARAGSAAAQMRLSIWTALTKVDARESQGWLCSAANGGDPVDQVAMERPQRSADVDEVLVDRLKCLLPAEGIGWSDLLILAMDRAIHRREPRLLLRALAVSLELGTAPDSILADKVYAALSYARSLVGIKVTVDTRAIEALLDDCVDRGNAAAALMLGMALSGCDIGTLHWSTIVPVQNRRKASALLLRAADAGYGEAWTRLFELHANNQSSVANPPMARFFLEKAAASGDTSAQRRLGAIVLKGAGTLREVEQGMNWLFLAAQSQDAHAQALLRTFLLAADGSDAEAERGITEIANTNMALAARLRVARDFGLTKLEAMTVDVVEGMRPWGLVVGKNPFIQHSRLSAPRAIPALRATTLQTLRRCAGQLAGGVVQSSSPKDLELRHRAARLKLVLDSHGLPESLFFAKATSDALDALRGGARWARLAKSQLDAAMDESHEATS